MIMLSECLNADRRTINGHRYGEVNLLHFTTASQSFISKNSTAEALFGLGLGSRPGLTLSQDYGWHLDETKLSWGKRYDGMGLSPANYNREYKDKIAYVTRISNVEEHKLELPEELRTCSAGCA